MFSFKFCIAILCSIFIKNITAFFCTGPFQCYLYSLKVTVPDFCASLPDSSTQLCIKNLICFDIAINKLPSAYLEPTTLYLGASGMFVLKYIPSVL